jgi:hypothetical protein
MDFAPRVEQVVNLPYVLDRFIARQMFQPQLHCGAAAVQLLPELV